MDAKKYAGVAWPGVLVLVTGIYAYWASQKELVSSRPEVPGQYDVADPLPTPGVSTVHSRIWEDPLSIAYSDWKKKGGHDLAQMDQGLTDASAYHAPATGNVVPDSSLPKTPPETLLDVFEDNGGTSVVGRVCPVMSQYQDHFQSLVKSHQTLCMPVFLTGGPYAEMKEKRMRMRYSVATALAESGYHLQYSQRMSYFQSKVFVRTLRGWVNHEIIVPVKLYRSSTTRSQVIVLWIDESQIGLRPLLATHRILNRMFCNLNETEQARLRVAIVGPASSDMLHEMVEEIGNLGSEENEPNLGQWDRQLHWRIASYESGGTLTPMVGYCPLLDPKSFRPPSPHSPISIYSSRATAEMDAGTMEKVKKSSQFTIHRVIGTDGLLVDLLASELNRRGVDLSKTVLITEHDTKYGREIQQTFSDRFGNGIRTYKILRGIDGMRPGDARREPKSSSPRDPSGGLPKVYEQPPAGRPQFDYLIRLHDELRELPDWRRPQAIGVVGSDIYDKLLVLRALRPQFPDCLFFTTDVDAVYEHPDERQHARNLLIASHFDLHLARSLQRETAPFRDSYQTATFLATTLAVSLADDTVIENWKDRISDVVTLMSEGSSGEGSNSATEMLCEIAFPESTSTDTRLWEDIRDRLQDVLVKSEQHLTNSHAHRFASVVDEVDRRVYSWKVARQLASPNHDIAPVLSVVGRDRIHRLRTHAEPSDDRELVSSWIHPAPSSSQRGWSLFFILLLICGSAVAISLMAAGDQLRVLPLADHTLIEFDRGWIEDTRGWRTELRIGTTFCLCLGLLLLGGLTVRAIVNPQTAMPFVGNDTWTKSLLYTLTGIAALLMAANLIEQFLRALHRQQDVATKTVDCALELFGPTQLTKSLLVSIVVIHAAISVLYGGLWTLLIAVVALGAIYAVKRYDAVLNDRQRSRSGDAPTPRDGSLYLWLQQTSTQLCRIAAAIVIGIAVIALVLHHPPADWYPRSLSRSILSRGLERLAELYAITMFAIFLAFLTGCNLYLVQISRFAKRRDRDVFVSREQRTSLEHEYDRLWFVGKLTSVTGVFAPLALLQLFVLVVAYHPIVAPVPMPLALLIVISTGSLLFLIPAFVVRWIFNREREQVLAEFGTPDRPDMFKEQKSVGGDRGRRQVPALVPTGVEADLGENAVAMPATANLHLPSWGDGGNPRGGETGRPARLRTKEKIKGLSEGIFRPLSASPLGWVIGGGASLALIDLWVRSWTYGM